MIHNDRKFSARYEIMLWLIVVTVCDESSARKDNNLTVTTHVMIRMFSFFFFSTNKGQETGWW